MNVYRFHKYATGRLLWLAVAVLLMPPFEVAGAAEERFDVLQIGTRVYTNVTVTTKARNYIFIFHSAGMASLKVIDLPAAVQKQLGYADATASKATTNTATVWMRKEIAKLNVPQIQSLRTQFEQNWRAQSTARLSAMGLMGPKLNRTVLGTVLLLCLSVYLFCSYCCMLICRKSGKPPGGLVWLPLVQLIPMLRAAGMSGWWLLACFVPVLNLVPAILWALNIAKARGKSVWTGVLLLLPVTSLFALLYLAFSDGASGAEDEGPEPKIMTLQAV